MIKLDRQRTKRIFEKLLLVAPELKQIEEHAKSTVPGLMDLNLDVLVQQHDYMRIALSHYWQHSSGDMIADPDMEIGVYWDMRLAEALTYQDMFIYEVAYQRDGGAPDLAIHTRINIFLEHWLENLAAQGHVLRRSI